MTSSRYLPETMQVLRPYVSTRQQPVTELVSHAWELLMFITEEHARIRLPCTLEVRSHPGRLRLPGNDSGPAVTKEERS
jgi:DNA-binding LacI/PurR family transcriptional regulator